MSIPITIILGSISILVLMVLITLLVAYIKHIRAQSFMETMQELLFALVVLLLLSIYVSLFFIWPVVMTAITIVLAVSVLISV